MIHRLFMSEFQPVGVGIDIIQHIGEADIELMFEPIPGHLLPLGPVKYEGAVLIPYVVGLQFFLCYLVAVFHILNQFSNGKRYIGNRLNREEIRTVEYLYEDGDLVAIIKGECAGYYILVGYHGHSDNGHALVVVVKRCQGGD